MAAAPASIGKELADIIECVICCEIYTDPRSLPCLHTFCFKCIEGFTRDLCPGDESQCPLCKKAFTILGNEVAGLPKNFFIEKMKILKDLAATSNLSEDYCQLCISSEAGQKMKEATVYCCNCEKKLCVYCDEEHSRKKEMRGHTRNRVGIQASASNVHNQSSFCDKHPEDKLRLYCCECKLVLCALCLSETHSAHKLVNINTMEDEFRRCLRDDVVSLGDNVDRYNGLKHFLDYTVEKFETETEEVKSTICAKADDLKREIERQKDALLTELETTQKERLKQTHHLMQDVQQHMLLLRSLKQYTEELCDNGSVVDIARETDKLHERSQELVKCGDDIQRTLEEFGSASVTFSPVDQHHATDVTTAQLLGHIVVDKTPVTPSGDVCLCWL